ncbi:MAG TPA: hypothetical protein H9837_01560 [Candidatus Brachybacterium merdigallinarum]|nr:hypothetical protein [Candidatus Brachybacterium merdigallinarum]
MLKEQVRDLESLVDELAERAGLNRYEVAKIREDRAGRIPEECKQLVADGKVIQAVKVYRERTGAGLKDAKDAIDAYRNQF